ncbi:lactonase family protein [Polynucleobacter sp. IMCC30063]|uniref:lactonase family protein n=1 Tax=Polynucleobacter sp. IMCC30063 TaxID=2907298 RepID=UPI001F1826A8|nr:beta-propeller fold lactonase family protein [Polynucleobacter sp. IMCC30063]MCE7506722.1 lactonase family protein [Polynucleobacter sp. IMCC30063]
MIISLAACGGGNSGTSSTAPATPDTPTTPTTPVTPTTYSTSATVSGLVGTTVLQNNGADNLSVAVNGGTTFTTQLANGASYAITVLTQPNGSTCVVNNGVGTIASANITNSTVVCTVNPSSGGGGDSGGGGGTPAPTATFTVSATVSGLVGTTVLQNNGGNNLSVSANGVTTFTTALANGAAYAVTVLTKPASQICTVFNGSGVIASANVTNVTVVCTGYAYVANFFGGVSMFSIPNSGILAPLSTPTVVTGSQPTVMTINSAGTFAYAVNNNSKTVSMYSIPGSGILAPIGTPVGTDVNPQGMAINPAGTFAYVTNRDSDSVWMYSISSGILAPLIPKKILTGAGPLGIAINPAGTFLYVANINGPSVSTYSINAGTGQLTNIDTTAFSGASNPRAIAINPAGTFLYVVNGSLAQVAMFSIAGNGLITALTPATISTGALAPLPVAIAINPAGTFLYVVNQDANNVAMYSIDAGTGQLTALGTPTIATGNSPQGISINSAGTFAYVTNGQSSTVSMYSIPNSGILAPLSTPTVPSNNPRGISSK